VLFIHSKRLTLCYNITNYNYSRNEYILHTVTSLCDKQVLGAIHQRRPVEGGGGCEPLWTTADGEGVGHEPGVDKRKKLFGVSISVLESSPPPLLPSTGIRIAIYIAFRTFLRAIWSESPRTGGGRGVSKKAVFARKRL